MKCDCCEKEVQNPIDLRMLILDEKCYLKIKEFIIKDREGE